MEHIRRSRLVLRTPPVSCAVVVVAHSSNWLFERLKRKKARKEGGHSLENFVEVGGSALSGDGESGGKWCRGVVM